MSLRVWLPLNGDLTNNGLSDVTVTNNGATVDNSGKIGKCYYFNGSSHIRISLPSELTSIKNSSVCAWVKSTGSTVALGGISSNSTYAYPMMTLYTSGWQFAGTSAYKYISGGSIANSGVWHHVCCTAADDIVTTYLDGVVIASKTYSEIGSDKWTLDPSINFIEIGCDHPGGDEYLTGYVNDFRVYNHALSPKEVKLLSQGLVCHYKLSGGGGDNIIPDTSPNESQYTYPSSSYSDKFSKTSTIVPSASQYVLSFWAKSTHAGDKVRAHWYSPNTTTRAETNQGATSTSSDGNIDFTLSDNWEKYWCIWTQSSTTSVKHFIFPRMFSQSSGGATGTGTVSVKFVKLEEGDTPTIWKPNKADSYYSYFEYDDKLVYDSSGYNNHMTAVGAPTVSINSIRNTYSTYFTNTQYAIANENSNTGWLPTEALTVNLWMYCTTWSNPISCTEGGGWNFENSSNIRFPVYIRGVGYRTANSSVESSTLLNNWHMLTGVFTGTEVKIYIDNELKGNTSTGSTNGIMYAANRLCIAAEAQSQSPASTAYIGNISDVRIYATALSQEDIQELYNTPVSVANTGAMMTQGEFVEVAT